MSPSSSIPEQLMRQTASSLVQVNKTRVRSATNKSLRPAQSKGSYKPQILSNQSDSKFNFRMPISPMSQISSQIQAKDQF